MKEPIYCDFPLDEIIANAEPLPQDWFMTEIGPIYHGGLMVDFKVLDSVQWKVPVLAGAIIDIKTKEIMTLCPEDRQPVLDALREWYADREKKRQQALTQKGEN